MLESTLSPPTISAALAIGDKSDMPPLLGITYALRKALPNIFADCLISGMNSNHRHLGHKLKEEAKRLGLKPGQVATVFGVKAPSVYDWYEHGRIHKRHYPALVKLSGKPIEWWLDFPPGNDEAGDMQIDLPQASPLSTFAQAIGMLYDQLPDDVDVRMQVFGEITALLLKAGRPPELPQGPKPSVAHKPKKLPA